MDRRARRRRLGSVTGYVQRHEYSDGGGAESFRELDGAPAFARHLALQKTLEAHTGCVNRLTFSSNGRYMASTSDDCRVAIWDLDTLELKDDLLTPHTHNVFGVRFLPSPEPERVATGGADMRVSVNDIETSRTIAEMLQHQDRVKTIETCESEPHMVWSCGEDNTVRQMDLRRVQSSNDHVHSQASASTLLRFPRGGGVPLKAAYLNPAQPHQMIVSSESVWVFDRRMLPVMRVRTSSGGRALEEAALGRFCPAHLDEDSADGPFDRLQESGSFATHAEFSRCGRKAVASFLGDHVYVFDVDSLLCSGRASLQRLPTPPERRAARPTASSERLRHAIAVFNRGGATEALQLIDTILRRDAYNVVVLHARAEVLLTRAYTSDHREAAVTVAKLQALVDQDERFLDDLVEVSEGAQTVGARQAVFDCLRRDCWRAALDIMKSTALLSMAVPRCMIEHPAVEQFVELADVPECSFEVSRMKTVVKRLLVAMTALHEATKRIQRCCTTARARLRLAGVTIVDGSEGTRVLGDSALNTLFGNFSSKFYASAVCARTVTGKVDLCASRDWLVTLTRIILKLTSSTTRRGVSSSMAAQILSSLHAWDEGGFSATETANSPDNQNCDVRDRPHRTVSHRQPITSPNSQPPWHCRSSIVQKMYEQFPRVKLFDVESYTDAAWSSMTVQMLQMCMKSRVPVVVYAQLVSMAKESTSDIRSSKFWGFSETSSYRARYTGHCNVKTDIKEATFFGAADQCIVSGSDDGCVYVWSASTGQMLNRLQGDQGTVNCVRQSPTGILVSSGLDSDIKVWSPLSDESQSQSRLTNDEEVCEREEVYATNWMSSTSMDERQGWVHYGADEYIGILRAGLSALQAGLTVRFETGSATEEATIGEAPPEDDSML